MSAEQYHVEQHWVDEDLADCDVEPSPHGLDAHRRDEPAFMRWLDEEVLTGVETLLAKYAAFDDYLREQGATS